MKEWEVNGKALKVYGRHIGLGLMACEESSCLMMWQPGLIITIIIIIVWLVRCWTLPFLRACSRLDDSALDDLANEN